jgi:hypothetical protein
VGLSFAEQIEAPRVILSELTAANSWPEGQIVYVTDLDAIYVSTGTSWAIAANAAPTTPSYALASLPAAGVAGRVVRVTDNIRGLWTDTGTQWHSITEFADARDWGVKADGVTDDYAACQQALDDIDGTVLVWPRGLIRTSATLSITEGTRMSGRLAEPSNISGYGTSFQPLTGANIDVFKGANIDVAGSNHWGHGIVIENLKIEGVSGQTAGSGIRMSMGEESALRNVICKAFPEAGFRFQRNQSPGTCYNIAAFDNGVGLLFEGFTAANKSLSGQFTIYGYTTNDNGVAVRVQCQNTDPTQSGGADLNLVIHGFKAEQTLATGSNDPCIDLVNLNGGSVTLVGGRILNHLGTSGSGTQTLVRITGSTGHVLLLRTSLKGYGRWLDDQVTGNIYAVPTIGTTRQESLGILAHRLYHHFIGDATTFTVAADDVAQSAAIFKGASGQTGPLVKWVDSADVTLSQINNDGRLQSIRGTTSYGYTTNVSGDSAHRYAVRGDGRLEWGPGTGAVDILLSRAAADRLGLAAGDSFQAGAQIYPATDALTLQTGGGLLAGTGVPNNTNGNNGDFYMRTDGTVAGNTVMYHKEAGAWVPLTTT